MANHYVRPTATGTSGADWNNAWSASTINESVINPGDTVWFAAGAHNSNLTFTKSGTSGSPITYSTVLATDAVPTSATGYQSSFATTGVFWSATAGTSSSHVTFPNNSTLDFEANFITVDGRVMDGFFWKFTTGGDACRLSQGGNGNNHCRLIHLTMIGSYAQNSNAAGYGISWWNGGGNFGRTQNYIGYCTIRGFCETLKWSNVNGIIVEYCNIGDTYNDSIDHEDTCFSYQNMNVIWRYNNIYNSPNDGFYNYSDTAGARHMQNWYFYGNWVYNYLNWCIVASQQNPDVLGPIYIFNNVFQSPNVGQSTWISPNGGSPANAVLIYNNIFINAENQFAGSSGNVLSDFNAYNTGTGKPGSGEGANSFTFTDNVNQFIHVAPPPPGGISETGNVGDPSSNFRLTPAGATLFKNKGRVFAQPAGFATSFPGELWTGNIDADGNTRGADGTWDIGAFEVTGGSGGPVAGTSRFGARSAVTTRATVMHDAKLVI